MRKILNGTFRFLPFRKDICGGEVYAGWNWFSWHYSVMEYVLSYLRDNPQYLSRWKLTNCCDELIFHTMLNDKTKELNIDRYNSLRFVEWHPKREFTTLPLVLDEREYEDIIESGAFFCRKIHPGTSEKLMSMLDNHIQLQENS